MKKVKKIKKIEPKVRVIREVKREEDIQKLTRDEIPLSKHEVEEAVEPVSRFSFGASSSVSLTTAPASLEDVTTPVPVQKEEKETDTRSLYEVGEAAGDFSGDKKYNAVENVSGPTMRQVDAGRQMGGFQSDGRTSGNSMEQEDDRNYDSSKIESQKSERKGHGYAWEQ